MKNRRVLSRGFTLIELLVVIAIIAMLLAILMPALGKVKEKARQVTCSAHMHNIGLVMNIYAGDYDSKLPMAQSTNDFGRWLFDVPWNIAEEIRVGYQLESIYCPANSLKSKKGDELEEYYVSHMSRTSGTPNIFDGINGGWAVTDYFWLLTLSDDRANNWRIYTDWVYPAGTRNEGKNIFVSKTTIKHPSSRPLVVDVVFTQSTQEPYDFSQIDGESRVFKSSHLNGTKATGGNILSCDGSVKWKKYETMENNYTDGSVKHFW